MQIKVPRSPYSWCDDCEGAGVKADADGVLKSCPKCLGQGRLKVEEPRFSPEREDTPVATRSDSEESSPAPAGVDMDLQLAIDDATAAPGDAPATEGGRDTPRRAPRPSPGRYFMGFAEHAATRSKDSTQVGAVLVGPHGEVRLTGYNGPPKGVKDTPDRFERPRKYLFSSHAEQNVIAFAARQGIRTGECTLYVTHHPCSSCARSIIQAGIVCVVVGGADFVGEWSQEIDAARQMFAEAGVAVRDV